VPFDGDGAVLGQADSRIARLPVTDKGVDHEDGFQDIGNSGLTVQGDNAGAEL